MSLRPLLALAIIATVATPAMMVHASAPPTIQAKPDILDLSGYQDHTIKVDEANAPIPAAATGIGPGTHLLIFMGGSEYGCTANFIWTDGTNHYLGAAGHCFVPEGYTGTGYPGADWTAANSDVWACYANCSFGGETGFSITGSLLHLGSPKYARQTDVGGDVGNDFGIVKIPSSFSAYERPGLPVWGRTTTNAQVGFGAPICHYGNGVAVGEVWPTMARIGVGIGFNGAVGTTGQYWLADLASAPGDSGSAVATCKADANGVYAWAASGILTHLVIGATGVTAGTTIPQAVNMASRDASLSISVVH